MDLLLTERYVINKTSAHVFLRLITILHPEVPCTEVLHDSLVLFAHLHAGQDISLREVEWKWAFRFLEVIKNLGRAPHLTLKSLMFIFGRIIKVHVFNIFVFLVINIYNFRYICGNTSIGNQLSVWGAKEDEREARSRASGDILPTSTYLEQHRARLAQQLVDQPVQQVAEDEPSPGPSLMSQAQPYMTTTDQQDTVCTSKLGTTSLSQSCLGHQSNYSRVKEGQSGQTI